MKILGGDLVQRKNSLDDYTVSRRGLMKLGALTLLAGAIPSILRPVEALAQSTVCNPGSPSTPAEALAALVAGNARWATNTQTHPGEDPTRRACLATNSQTPWASILSCSDSRCPPALIFDQGLGDLFVARVAGNCVPGNTNRAHVSSTLDFGSSALQTQILFVLGHTACGAVVAAVNSFPRSHSLAFVNFIRQAVRQARRIVKQGGGDPTDPTQVIPVATEQNVLITISRLQRALGPSVPIYGGVYDLGTQLVNVLVPSQSSARNSLIPNGERTIASVAMNG